MVSESCRWRVTRPSAQPVKEIPHPNGYYWGEDVVLGRFKIAQTSTGGVDTRADLETRKTARDLMIEVEGNVHVDRLDPAVAARVRSLIGNGVHPGVPVCFCSQDDLVVIANDDIPGPIARLSGIGRLVRSH